MGVRTFTGHTRSVKTTAFRKDDPSVFASGGRDGAILIWDIRATVQPRADNCIYSGHAGGPGTPTSYKRKTRQTPKLPPNVCSSSITGLAFQDNNTLVSCGAGDGIIKVWDLRRNYSIIKREPLPKYSIPYAGTSTFKGFTNLLIDNAGVKLYVNCMDNNIYCYNLSTYSPTPISKYSGLKNSTFYIKSCLSPDNNYLLSGSTDEKAYIWNVNQYDKSCQPLLTLNGHTVEVTCVAWNQNNNDVTIVTCSDDARHKIWKFGPEVIRDDEKPDYFGNAEMCQGYNYNKRKTLKRKKLLEYESTPRSIKRFVERNEKTPSLEKPTNIFEAACGGNNKRSFETMCDGDMPQSIIFNEQKRLNIEGKGRRLFSPTHNAIYNNGNGLNLIDFTSTSKNLSIVLEESPGRQTMGSPSSPSATNNKSSPLSDFNLKSPETPTSHRFATSLVFSPTTNLPNYVIDGEAPHLRIISPRKTLKENVDWLTKIRKQRLLNINAARSKPSSQVESASTDEKPDIVCLSSPRLQLLKGSESPSYATPKRRRSRSNSISDSIHPKTPKSTLRSSSSGETSILNFFSVTNTSSSSTTTYNK